MSAARARWWIVAGVLLVLALAFTAAAINPANLPQTWLGRWLTASLPPGSSIVAVRNTIEAKHWPTIEEGVSRDGSMVLVLLGQSWFNRRYAYAWFSFDRFGRLTSIDVQKHEARLEPRNDER